MAERMTMKDLQHPISERFVNSKQMKINIKNTALGLLDHIDPWAFRMCEDGERSSQEYKTKVGLSIVEQFPKCVHLFSEKIQYISDPFHKAFLKAQHRLVDVLGKEPIHEHGTFISQASPSETNTIFYSLIVDPVDKGLDINAVIFFFTKETSRDKPALAIVVQKNKKGFKSYLSEVAIRAGLDEMKIIADIYTLILFMKYCDLETKVIKAGKKDRHVGEKYLNESKYNIEILDSTWFTTIIRSEGFHVGGHFRMQPYGPNNSMRKLIWIEPFDKHGYTRTAKAIAE